MGCARLIALLAALAFAQVPSGCGHPGIQAPDAAAAPARPLAWPRPPAEARVRFVRNVTTPADWGLARSAFQGFVDKVTGQKPFRFVRPTGVAQRGRTLYVADAGAQALVVLDATQSKEIVVTRVGREALASPVAVALGPGDTVLLADSALGKVFVLDAHGALLRTIGGEARLGRPAGVAYDSAADQLYVSDSSAHRIVVYAGDGRFLGAFGRNGAAPGELNYPTHLALAKDGRLIVTDTLNFRVQVLDREGRPLLRFGRVGDGSGDFASPKGVATDSAGDFYVVDALFDAVQVFGADGALMLGFGERGTRDGQFSLPTGLFIGTDDAIYVADSYNQRIAVFQRVRTSAEGASR
jgi:DNA-binding beta-propeller fold protein YncE